MQYRWAHSIEPEHQQWVLKRNCALRPRQLAACFGVLAAVSLAIASIFAWHGAWLVVPFACLEMGALAVAFVVYARHAADYDRIEPVAAENGLWLLCDAAQGFGAAYKGRKVGTIGMATTTSFFPAKPLGAYGDGGAVFTDDDEMAALLRSLLFHGKGDDRYDNVRIGMNGRLDSLQAGVLIEKLAIFPDEIDARNRIAARYSDGFSNILVAPHVPEGSTSVWAQYTLRAPGHSRDTITAALKEQGVPTAIYYPKPLHQQTAYRTFPVVGGSLPVSERAAGEVFSLPMHAYLDEETQDFIIGSVRSALQPIS